MSETTKLRSVQVGTRAHAKVLALAEAMGLTQHAAASLLVDVADEQAAIAAHHNRAKQWLAGKAPAAGKARTTADPADGGGGRTRREAAGPPEAK